MVTDSENVVHTSDKSALMAARSTQHSSPRKVLGQLSTNVQLTPKVLAPLQAKKFMTSTPVKRSFVSNIDDAGFTYLKRRRLSYSTITESTEALSAHDRPGSAGVMHLPHTPLLENINDDASDGDRESSAERHSFSSLINYDPSSQNHPSSQTIGPILSPDPDTDTDTTQISQAEMLRIRLRMAMYKVRTQQTAVSFDYLREDTESGSKESNKAVQEAVDQLRQEAYARLALAKIKPDIALTPALPTSDSAISPVRRLIDDNHLTITPLPPRLGAFDGLTSSAVKGQVAEGLLGLKNGFQP